MKSSPPYIRKHLFSCCWLRCSRPRSASAQSYRGSIRGRVVDPSGGVIAAAKVTAKNNATGLSRDTLTRQPTAVYVLAELPAGEYIVTAESAGLSPVAQNVMVSVGLDTTANFDLTQIEKKTEQVTVNGPRLRVVDDQVAMFWARLSSASWSADLPLNGRDFGKLVALVPGATVEPSGVAAIQSGFGQFSINGSRDRSNNYTLDGTDNNDPFFNNSAFNQTGIGGAPASILPIDAIQEFNLQSQFPAEYGRNSGSVVNIITKSGTNQFHGSAFEFVRNDMFDARNYFNRVIDADGDSQPKTDFRNNQFGASLGGPIIKDKTFFFGAYEGQRERVDFGFHPSGSHCDPDRRGATVAGRLWRARGVPTKPALTSILNQVFRRHRVQRHRPGTVGGRSSNEQCRQPDCEDRPPALQRHETLSGVTPTREASRLSRSAAWRLRQPARACRSSRRLRLRACSWFPPACCRP